MIVRKMVGCMNFKLRNLNGQDAVRDKEERRKIMAEACRNIEQKNIENKRFVCAPCGFNGTSQWKLDEHYKTKKHKKNSN